MATNKKKRRAARRKLKAHDRGVDRHNKGLEWMKKMNRKSYERSQGAT